MHFLYWVRWLSLPCAFSTSISPHAGLSILFPVLRWSLEKVIFIPLVKSISPSSSSVTTQHQPPPTQSARSRPRSDEKRVVKMTESLWKLLCYSTFVALLARHTIGQGTWFLDTRQYWIDWPNQIGIEPLRLICAIELAFYLSGGYMLLFWEVKRKDHLVMMTHHMMSITLIAACYYNGYFRAGCVIMLIHDCTDVLMETAKLFEYQQLSILANTFFVLFLVAWLALRMIAFPAWIMWSTIFEVVQVLGTPPPGYLLINTLFVVLYFIHCYWFVLILKVAYGFIVSGKAEDLREGENSNLNGEAHQQKVKKRI